MKQFWKYPIIKTPNIAKEMKQKLFDFIADLTGHNLLDSEMNDIIGFCNEINADESESIEGTVLEFGKTKDAAAYVEDSDQNDLIVRIGGSVFIYDYEDTGLTAPFLEKCNALLSIIKTPNNAK